MEARATNVARVSARFSKSLARRRFRPNQEKVRLTTPLRGRTTKPFVLSLRLTISIRSAGTFATELLPLPGVVAAIGPDQFQPREAPAYFVEDQPGPVAVLVAKFMPLVDSEGIIAPNTWSYPVITLRERSGSGRPRLDPYGMYSAARIASKCPTRIEATSFNR